MSLSTHILDTAIGRPAANVSLTLSQLDGESWRPIGSGQTDADGRCKTLLGNHPLEAATYKIHFHTADYFHRLHLTSLYPFVEIVFTVTDPAQHHHIPLLLTANAYTTYRGS
jgi:5-hydroxyisourate hydrolase